MAERTLQDEVSRLKGQNAVLKRAVIKEQQQNNTLLENVKIKEQELRLSVEEIDALNFNNQRLKKRVEALMAEVAEVKEKLSSSSSWFGWGSSAQAERLSREIEVLKEELATKIQENELLHMQTFDLKTEHEQRVEELEGKISELKQHIVTKHNELVDIEQMHQFQIEKMSDEKDILLRQVGNLERDLESSHRRLADRERVMTDTNDKLTLALEELQLRFETKVVFDDTRSESLNRLNVPPFDRIPMTRRLEIAEHALSLFRQMSTNFNVHFSAFRERLSLSSQRGAPLSNVMREAMDRIISELPQHHVLLDRLYNALSAMRARLRASMDFANHSAGSLAPEGGSGDASGAAAALALAQLAQFHRRLLSYVLLCFEEETKHSASVTLRADTSNLAASFRRLGVVLQKLARYAALAEGSECGGGKVHRDNAEFILECLVSAVGDLHRCFLSMSDSWASKVRQEHQAPFVVPAARVVNDRLVSSLATLVNTVGKLAQAMGDFRAVASLREETIVRGARGVLRAEGVGPLEERARRFFLALHMRDLPAPVSYNLSISAAERLDEVRRERDALTQRLAGADVAAAAAANERVEAEAENKRLQERVEELLDEVNELQRRAEDIRATAERAQAEKQRLEVELSASRRTTAAPEANVIPAEAHASGSGVALESGSGAAAERGAPGGGRPRSSSRASEGGDASVVSLRVSMASGDENAAFVTNTVTGVSPTRSFSPRADIDQDDPVALRRRVAELEEELARAADAETRAPSQSRSARRRDARGDTVDLDADDRVVAESDSDAGASVSTVGELGARSSDERRDRGRRRDPTRASVESASSLASDDAVWRSAAEASRMRAELKRSRAEIAQLRQQLQAERDRARMVLRNAGENADAREGGELGVAAGAGLPALLRAVVRVSDADSGAELDEDARAPEIGDSQRERMAARYFGAQISSLRRMVERSNAAVCAAKEQAERAILDADRARTELSDERQRASKEQGQSREFQDNLESVTRNYEEQLKVLTEHLMEVQDKNEKNEKRVKQLLKAKVLCGVCRTWNSVGWLVTKGKNGRCCSTGNHASSYNYAPESSG